VAVVVLGVLVVAVAAAIAEGEAAAGAAVIVIAVTGRHGASLAGKLSPRDRGRHVGRGVGQ
jgi:hypothetical protein